MSSKDMRNIMETINLNESVNHRATSAITKVCTDVERLLRMSCIHESSDEVNSNIKQALDKLLLALSEVQGLPVADFETFPTLYKKTI